MSKDGLFFNVNQRQRRKLPVNISMMRAESGHSTDKQTRERFSTKNRKKLIGYLTNAPLFTWYTNLPLFEAGFLLVHFIITYRKTNITIYDNDDDNMITERIKPD